MGAAALLLLAAGCGSIPAGSAGASVRVVLVDAFTGPSAVRGVTLQNSLQIEIDAIDAAGGLLGRRVELVSADDEVQPAKSADLVREHLADERAGLLVGPGATSTYLAARPFIDGSHVLNCLPVRIADSAVAGAPYSFRTRPADQTAAGVLLAYVRQHMQARKLGAVAASDADAQAADQALGGAAQAAGLTYVGSASLATAPDAHSAVQDLAGRGAQALVLLTDATAGAQTARAAQDLGLPVLGFEDEATLDYPDQAGDAAAGTVLAAPIQSLLTAASPATWPPAYRVFEQAVAGRYGYVANGVQVKGLPEAAECVRLWARAVQQAGTFDGALVTKAWERLRVSDREAVLGVPEQFAAGQHDAVGANGVFVYQWAKQGSRYRLQQVAA